MSIKKQVTKKNDKKQEVLIRGWLMGLFKENHRLDDGAIILENNIRTVDFYGNVKPKIPIQIDSRCLERVGHHFDEGEFVELCGEFRTKNVYDETGKKIQRRCYVFVRNIELVEEELMHPENHVSVRGLLARKGKIHHCKNGSVMFDFTVDVRRSYGRRSSIPCVIWGNERAQFLSKLNKDTIVEVDGWIKNRTITDSLGITKAVAEIIVENFSTHEDV